MQNVVPLGQPPHTPLLHDWPLGHARPHAPQFAGSAMSATQWSVQKVVPLGQPPHTPLLHAWPLGHARPHAPQFIGSAMSATQ